MFLCMMPLKLNSDIHLVKQLYFTDDNKHLSLFHLLLQFSVQPEVEVPLHESVGYLLTELDSTLHSQQSGSSDWSTI